MAAACILVTCDCTLCPEALDPLRRIGQVAYECPVDRPRLLEVIGQYDAVMCGAEIKFDRQVFSRAEHLRVIATPSTGTDHIDKKVLDERGIEQIDIAREYDLLDQFTATAEGAWGLLLAGVRQLPKNFERAKRGLLRLEDSSRVPRQLSGKTLGVIGYGRLGRMIGQYGKAFRMKVLCHDVKRIDEAGVRQVDLDTLLAESDVISLHLHLTDQTQHFLTRKRIAQMRRGVILVNTARGDLIDEAALVEALESGQIQAAGLDVVHNEWDPNLAEHALHEYARTHDNLIITPHITSGCYESIRGARICVAQKLAEWLKTNSEG